MCVCRKCGRTLTNPASVAVGAGPKCEPRPKKPKRLSRQCCFAWAPVSALDASCGHVECAIVQRCGGQACGDVVNPNQLRLPNIDTLPTAQVATFTQVEFGMWCCPVSDSQS